MSNLNVFGSLCYAATLKASKKKLDSTSRKYIYLGYKPGVKGHILFDLHCKELFLSRDIVFSEFQFPYKHGPSPTQVTHHNPPLHYSSSLDEFFYHAFMPTLPSQPSSTPTTISPSPSHQIGENPPNTSLAPNTSNIPSHSSDVNPTPLHIPDKHVCQKI